MAVKKEPRTRWKWILAYALVLLAICFLLYYYKEAYLGFRDLVHFFSSKTRVNRFVASFGPYAPVTFIGLQALQVLIAPIPGELTGFIGGYLFGILPGFLYSTLGLTAGSLLAFLIARRFGLPLIRRFIAKEIMDKFDYLMEHQGAFFSFIFFLIPGLPKDYFCYLLGLSPMHIITFFLVCTIGRLPGTLLLSLQGQAVRSEHYRGFFVVLGIALFFIVLAVLYRDRLEGWLKPKKTNQRPP
jgi:uncharacterized membrane protein YdjX (TVP38/TMEM64 family)